MGAETGHRWTTVGRNSDNADTYTVDRYDTDMVQFVGLDARETTEYVLLWGKSHRTPLSDEPFARHGMGAPWPHGACVRHRRRSGNGGSGVGGRGLLEK